MFKPYDFRYQADARVPAFDDRFPIARMHTERAPRNGVYVVIPRNRCLGFGRGEQCGLQSATLRAQLMSDPP